MTDFPAPTLKEMIDDLNLLGLERRDHITNMMKSGRFTEQEIQAKQYRLHIYREAVRKFVELTKET